jgi:hypothetical protein
MHREGSEIELVREKIVNINKRSATGRRQSTEGREAGGGDRKGVRPPIDNRGLPIGGRLSSYGLSGVAEPGSLGSRMRDRRLAIGRGPWKMG